MLKKKKRAGDVEFTLIENITLGWRFLTRSYCYMTCLDKINSNQIEI